MRRPRPTVRRSVPALAPLLCLAFAAAPAAAPLPPAPGAVPVGSHPEASPPPEPRAGEGTGSTTGLTAVLLYRDRHPRRLAPPTPDALSPNRLAGLTAAWAWCEGRPPRRFEPRGLAAELAQLAEACDGAPTVVPALPVRLAEGTEEPFDDLRVVAGPRELFREVPEGWLPHQPLPADGVTALPWTPGTPWRLRLVGLGRGTGWLDLEGREREAVLSPQPAGDVRLVIAGAEGAPLPEAGLTVLETLHGTPRPAVLSQHRSDDRGVLHVPALPAEISAAWVAGAPGHASRVLRGRPADLPAELRLPPAATVRGRFVDGDGTPLAGIRVDAEGWLDDDVPVRFQRRGDSGDDGVWEIGSLPPRPMALAATGDGWAPHHGRLEPVPGEVVDLGAVTLYRGRDLAVVVRDDLGTPVAGATVVASALGPGSASATSDDVGRALLTDLPAGRIEVRARATDHLEGTAELRPPWPDDAAVTLTRAFVVEGSFLDDRSLPPVAAQVRVEQGNSFRFEEPGDDGTFRLLLEPDLPHTLRLSSPTTARRTIDVKPGRPGETRDLGSLTAPPGVVAWGTVLSAHDGTPVVGARVWTPRPSRDPVGTWFHGDLLETRTDDLGRFELGGLDGKPEVLRIDAAGFARGHLPVQPESGAAEVDLGEAELVPGALVRVHFEDAAELEGAQARLDLRGHWLDLDMLVAPVVDGTAELPRVPPGEALLTVLAQREIVCEKTVQVPADDTLADVSCDGGGPQVEGLVLTAGAPAGPGTLEWSSTEPAPVSATIFTRRSPLGLPQQQVVGRGRPPVRVEVGADGRFASDRLAAGTWTVTWWPAEGTPAAPRRVEVPQGPEPRVTVAVDGGAVAGRVVDEAGLPVAGIWVRRLDGAGGTRSGNDGGFRLHGLSPGTVRLQARDGERFSQVAEAWVEEDRPADPVELVLSADHAGRLEAEVRTDAGLPAEGAFVFLDTGDGGIQVVSTDGEGIARITLAAPYPQRVRLAACHRGRWSFGSWTPWERTQDGVEQVIAPSGELLVETGDVRHGVGIQGPEGWDLSRLLGLLGTHPTVAPEQPLLLSGLPEGLYQVDGTRTVQVRSDHRERVELD